MTDLRGGLAPACSVFVFTDSLVVSTLQDVGGYAISAKITLSCLWVAIPYACGADGRADVRSCDYQT